MNVSIRAFSGANSAERVAAIVPKSYSLLCLEPYSEAWSMIMEEKYMSLIQNIVNSPDHSMTVFIKAFSRATTAKRKTACYFGCPELLASLSW